MEIIQIKNLSFLYPGQEGKTLSDISLNIQAGEYVVICGRSGSGKTTLLRHLKPALTPFGEKSGEILYRGQEIEKLSANEAACEIGYVLQSPEAQVVTDKVWHELAFGLENLGLDNATIRRRCGEMAQFFGIEDWFEKDVSELSGGQKQLLSLASVMVMQPKVLILDEPTAQLDPIAASEFLGAIRKINRELGTTIILSEHRLEEVLPCADQVVVMEQGMILTQGTAREVGSFLKDTGSDLFLGMPASMRIWASVGGTYECPISVREGKTFLEQYEKTHELQPVGHSIDENLTQEVALRAENVWFAYERGSRDVLKGLSFEAHKREHFCLLGGNGSGKTTLLKLLSKVQNPIRGSVECFGKVGMLPQDPQALFLKKTVREDLLDALRETNKTAAEKQESILKMSAFCRIDSLLERHPFDLSGGEQQRVALAKVLLREPEILLLDEPTKGLDAAMKATLAKLLMDLKKSGICILTVSHDVEFCASYADRCGLLFDGQITSEGEPAAFFGSNNFYTTAANRICRDFDPNVVTCKDAIRLVGGEDTVAEPEMTGSGETAYPVSDLNIVPQPPQDKTISGKLPLWRKLGTAISVALAMLVYLYSAKQEDMRAFIDHGKVTSAGMKQLGIYGVFILCLILAACFLGKGKKRSIPQEQTAVSKRKLSKRTKAAAFMILLMIPLTLYVGVVYLAKKQYYVTATAVLLECMIPFFLVFEGKRPKARELVLTASLCAINVAGRVMFFMLPQFKPVMAMTIIAGASLGGETGFLVGAVTMLVSNILFSQGPWTPWQMFAMGIIGYLAGVLYQKGILLKNKVALCIFGAFSAIVIYGGIMNPTSVFIWSGESLNLKVLLAYYISGFPFDVVHAFATVIFLWFGAEPMLEKLDRIKAKYGLLE